MTVEYMGGASRTMAVRWRLMWTLRLMAAAMLVTFWSPAHARNIDFELLYQAARLANLTYDGSYAILGEAMARQSRAYVAVPGDTDVQYFIGYNDPRKIQVVGVRGTSNDINWQLNRDRRGVVDPKTGVMLHAGYKRAADALYADLKPRLKKGYTTYLTGHSLGGAVAAILGIYLKRDGWPVEAIITFGQPKFTNAAGAQVYADLPIIRVVNQNDIVPLFPDGTLGRTEQFVHVGPAVVVYPGPHYVYAPADRATAFSAGSFRRFLLQGSIPDHRMRFYEENLRSKRTSAVRVNFADRERYIVRRWPNRFPPGAPGSPVRQQNFTGSVAQ